MAAAGGTIGLAKGLGSSAPVVSELLQAAPGSQAVGAGIGGAASEIARQDGASPLAQALIGVGAGVTGGAAAGIGNAAVRGSRQGVVSAIKPFTRKGQEDIAGTVLAEQATDARAAQDALEGFAESVPGSIPQSGVASLDAGIMATQKTLSARNPARAGGRLSDQNAARQSAIDEIGGDASDIARAKAARDAETTPMRETAFVNAQIAQPARVISKIDEILASPKGKRIATRDALTTLKTQLEGVTDAESLYSVRQNIGDMLSGKVSGETANLKLAKSQLIEVRKELDNAIEAAAPGFKAYLARYRDLSKPINQMEVIQEIQKRSALAAPDPTTGREFLSQARFRQRLNKAKETGDFDELNPKQQETLNAVAADLDLGAAIQGSLLRSPGSDTFQNLSSATILSSMVGKNSANVHPIVQTLVRPMNWLYTLPDDAVMDILENAMYDPKLAAKLLRRGNRKNMRVLSFELRKVARGLGLGSTVAGATTQGSQQKTESQQ